jgi:phage I-like protein
MWTTFDAIGEITLTTKGKDSDPSTTAITTVSDAAVLMLGMAKEDYWDSWET